MNENVREEQLDWTIYEAAGHTRINFVSVTEWGERHSASWTLTTPTAQAFFRHGDRQLNRPSWRSPHGPWPTPAALLTWSVAAAVVALFVWLVTYLAMM